MNEIKVKCLKCGKEWTKECSHPWEHKDTTSSLCDSCYRKVASPLIHKRQLREGNFDCFAKATDYCDQFLCKYRKFCFVGGEENAG